MEVGQTGVNGALAVKTVELGTKIVIETVPLQLQVWREALHRFIEPTKVVPHKTLSW